MVLNFDSEWAVIQRITRPGLVIVFVDMLYDKKGGFR